MLVSTVVLVFSTQHSAKLFVAESNNVGVSSDLDICRVGTRVMDELVKPLKKADIDDTEFACIKAIVFFDPSK